MNECISQILNIFFCGQKVLLTTYIILQKQEQDHEQDGEIDHKAIGLTGGET